MVAITSPEASDSTLRSYAASVQGVSRRGGWRDLEFDPSVSDGFRLQHSLRCKRKKELDVGYYCCLRGESHHGNCPSALANIGFVGGAGAVILCTCRLQLFGGITVQSKKK